MNTTEGRNSFDDEIERRLKDPLWDHRMSRDVLRRRHSHLTRFRMAAGISILAGGLAVGFYSQTMQQTTIVSRITGIVQSRFATGADQAAVPDSTYSEMQITDSDAFPYHEDPEVAILLDRDVFGE